MEIIHVSIPRGVLIQEDSMKLRRAFIVLMVALAAMSASLVQAASQEYGIKIGAGHAWCNSLGESGNVVVIDDSIYDANGTNIWAVYHYEWYGSKSDWTGTRNALNGYEITTGVILHTRDGEFGESWSVEYDSNCPQPKAEPPPPVCDGSKGNESCSN